MIPFNTNQEDRATYGVVTGYLKNMFVEKTPMGPTPDARFSRPGLLYSFTAGSGPIRGMYQNAGAVGGSIYSVSDDEFYENDDLRGSLVTGDRARFAGSATQIVVVQGGNAYTWDGVSFALVNDTDLPPGVYDVTYAFGRFIYAIQGTDTFYYSIIGDARQIDGLAFASAESSPDAIQAVTTLSDEIAFFGQNSVEWWTVTTDPDQPFQRTIGRRYDRGLYAQGSLQNIDNSLIWLGDDGIVYRTGNVPIRISTHSIEERIRKCTDTDDSSSLNISFDGHTFYGLSLPGIGTYLIDLSNNTWAQWTSQGETEFRCRWNTKVADNNYLGDSNSGKVFTLDPETYRDDEDFEIERVAAVFVPVDQGFVQNSSLMLQCRRGVGNSNEPLPTVSMRYSDTATANWETSPGSVSIGGIGQYEYKTTWRRLGRMQSPGRLFEFTCTDPVSVVYEAISLNFGRP